MTEDVKKEFVLTKSVYKEVFMAFYKPLCLFARKILSCEEDAEDMVHNVFLAIWERKMSFIDKSHLKVYLYRAVYNQSLYPTSEVYHPFGGSRGRERDGRE